LNSRERFIRVIHFEEADRAPHAEQFWPETVGSWYVSGSVERDYRGVGYDPATPFPTEGVDYDALCPLFQMDMRPQWNSNSYFYPTEFSPMFPRLVLREGDTWVTVCDEWGITKRVRRDGTSVPQFTAFPVKHREDFDAMKARLDPFDQARFKPGWGTRARKALDEGSAPLGWGMVGFFALLRWLMGLEGALLAFLKEPWLVRHIFDYWSNFVVELAKPALELQVDYLGIWEDLAYKVGPMISPRVFKELMVPYYKRVTNAFKKRGVDVAIVDSDGNIEALIPYWLEGGVNGLVPLETQAGVDAPAIREKYGDRVVLMGNISLWALRQGSEAIDRELERKLAALLPGGGYIISPDHHVPPDVTYKNYLHYLTRVLKQRGYTWKP